MHKFDVVATTVKSNMTLEQEHDIFDKVDCHNGFSILVKLLLFQNK